MRTAEGLSPWGAILSGLLWKEILADGWRFIKHILAPDSQGVYEVLEYESSLELKDARGRRAIFKKREKIRYLQNNIIAYQDQAWGDGEILVNSVIPPGVQRGWKSDGTEAGTVLIANINPRVDECGYGISSNPAWLMGDVVFYRQRWRARKGAVDIPIHFLQGIVAIALDPLSAAYGIANAVTGYDPRRLPRQKPRYSDRRRVARLRAG